jgi:hypothetical protein
MTGTRHHTSLADIAELITPSPQAWGKLRVYVRRMQRSLVEVTPVAPKSRTLPRCWKQDNRTSAPESSFSQDTYTTTKRHEHGGVTHFVTGGAGAHAYPIERAKDDPFQSKEVNYHYLQVEDDSGKLKVIVNRLDLTRGTPCGPSLIRSQFRYRRQRPQRKADSRN